MVVARYVLLLWTTSHFPQWVCRYVAAAAVTLLQGLGLANTPAALY